MRLFRNGWVILGSALMCFAAACFSLLWALRTAPIEEKSREELQYLADRQELSIQLRDYLNRNELPEQARLDFRGEEDEYKLTYTINPSLQKEADRLLKSYKPDYGAVVVIDTKTGQILALSSFQRNQQPQQNLALKGSYPAASIFKIITATAAIDKYALGPETRIAYNGGNHTLYKKNVMSNVVNRWTREITLREAFARSINTVFGRLTFEKLDPLDLDDYARKFGFNSQIQSEIPFDAGFTDIPKEKNFHLAEVASGFNRVTTMSPVQGAMIAASVANDGIMPVPYLVESVKNSSGEEIYKGRPVVAARTMSAVGAEKIRDLMEATITDGTSRRSFRPLLRNRKFKELTLGGKTGSLTGLNPKGKTDWFVGYAIGDNGSLAIAALTVNVNFWTVKSSHLAQSLFQRYFKDQFTKENEEFFRQASQKDNSTETGQ